MKKIFITALSCLISFVSYSQHSLTGNHHMFRNDDILIKQQVDYKDPGRSGENVLWDFSKLVPVNEEYTLNYMSENDSVILGIEHSTMYRYKLSNDSLQLWGFENPTTLIKNESPELIMKFPVSYGDTNTAYYSGTGRYCERFALSVMGTVETSADAYGMMILPNQDTLKNVFRIKSVKLIAEDLKTPEEGGRNMGGFISSDSIDFRLKKDSTILVLETYRWYEKGYRYPIFETVKSWEQTRNNGDCEVVNTAFFFPPQDHYYLGEDPDNLALLEEEKTIDDTTEEIPEDISAYISYNFYPNPVENLLAIEYYIEKECQVGFILVNIFGQQIHVMNPTFHKAGLYYYTINMSGLPKGNYPFYIHAGGYDKNEVIIKK